MKNWFRAIRVVGLVMGSIALVVFVLSLNIWIYPVLILIGIVLLLTYAIKKCMDEEDESNIKIRCEQCHRPLTDNTVEYDIDNVPLCHKCMAELIKES